MHRGSDVYSEGLSWLGAGAVVVPLGLFPRRLKAGILICAETEPLSNLTDITIILDILQKYLLSTMVMRLQCSELCLVQQSQILLF